MYFPPSTTKVVENIQQNSLFALDYSTLVASSESAKFCLSKINIIFLNSRLFMTRLSILNSCRSGVDIYWTNLSPARVLYFEFLTKPAVRLNQILKYPENFWRGEGNRLAPKCKFLQTCLSLSSFHLLYPPPPPLCLALVLALCAKTWTGVSVVSEFFYFFVIAFTRSMHDDRVSTSVRASCNRSNLTHDGFSRRHMDQKHIYIALTFDWSTSRCSLCGCTQLILLFETVKRYNG